MSAFRSRLMPSRAVALLPAGAGTVRRPAVVSADVSAEDETLAHRLHAAMPERYLYRRPDLSLSQLSSELGITSHHLSRVLNAAIGGSFNDFVARHRVEDVRRRLLDGANDHYSIDGIAEAAGFRTRSTFYAAFRRFTGTTPREFRAANRRDRE